MVNEHAYVPQKGRAPFPNLFASDVAAAGVSGPANRGYLSGNGLLSAMSLGRITGLASTDLVPNYNHGRILLAGDAAHLNSPSGDMGMNGGLHDAHNLTENLNKIWTGDDLSLLDLYSRQRKPIAERQIIEQADKNRKRMTERDPTKRRKALAEMRAITDDPVRCESFLMKSSMIEGLREADLIK